MMTTQNRIKTVLTLAAVAMAILVLTAASANAATMSASLTAPDVGSLDVANYNHTGDLDKWFCIAGEGASKVVGQTFTTGSDEVLLNAITYQISDTQQAPPIKTYTIRVCTVNRVNPGDSSTWVLTEIYTETATQDVITVNSSEYMTWTLDTPLLLAAETEYGIDVGMNSSTSGWRDGISYVKYSKTDQYGGGTRYWSGTGNPAGIGDSAMNNVSGERVFHIDMLSADPDSPTVNVGVDMITWSGGSVPLDPNIVEVPGSGWTELTYLWSAEPSGIGDPNLDVAITDADKEDASVTITKTAGDAVTVTLTLTVNNAGEPPERAVTDTMTVDVYDDACFAAEAAGTLVIDPTDIDENCITNFGDFAVMATTWLDDYTLTGPVAK